ncbi:MAG: hypothetical protein ABI609_12885 [Acidobacteriota bacterium]
MRRPCRLGVVAALLASMGCASRSARLADHMAGVHDELASTPAGSQASVIYPVSPGGRATLIFLPAANRFDAAALRAAGLGSDLARRLARELAKMGRQRRPLLAVAEGSRLEFSSDFADSADVVDVVFGECTGRCRITLRSAGPGLLPRVLKVG